LISLLLSSCGREGMFETEVEDIPVVPVQLQDMIILGFTKDVYGNPIADVEVKIGEIAVLSDKEGLYHFERAGVSTTGSILKASKFNYETELTSIKPNTLGILQIDFILKKSSSSLVGNINTNNSRLNGVNFTLDINHISLTNISNQNTFSASLRSITKLDSVNPILLPATINPKTNQDVEIIEQFELQVRNTNNATILKSDTINHQVEIQTNEQKLFRLDILRGVWVLEKSVNNPSDYLVKQDEIYGIGNFTTRFPVTMQITNNNKDPLTNIPYFIKTVRGITVAKGTTDGEGIIASRLPNNTEFVVELVAGCSNTPTKVAEGKVGGTPQDLGRIIFNEKTQLRLSFKLCDGSTMSSSRTPLTVEIKQGRSNNRLLMNGNSLNSSVNLCPGSGLIEINVISAGKRLGGFTFSDEQVKSGTISLTDINLCLPENLYGKINIDNKLIVYKSEDFKILKQDEFDIGITDLADLTIILSNVKGKGNHKISQFAYLKQPQIECKNNCDELKAEVIRFGNVGQVIEVKITGMINNKNIDCLIKNIRFS
jgi:hypothetical protein